MAKSAKAAFPYFPCFPIVWRWLVLTGWPGWLIEAVKKVVILSPKSRPAARPAPKQFAFRVLGSCFVHLCGALGPEWRHTRPITFRSTGPHYGCRGFDSSGIAWWVWVSDILYYTVLLGNRFLPPVYLTGTPTAASPLWLDLAIFTKSSVVCVTIGIISPVTDIIF
ncbi:hypothetical protein F4813DRAFT_334457 [Daldinia decipiens]|uniref:uncharacterized protein n=1 Tax=Daldinia decipiens TaxID=326647 RepID=UPI0020C4AF94|nr:uncharacterized protein F4813DRAFT_334457 [Daldinia decipiens]KAI1659467.1 hypothetical protein F4813DRAFT_334457 [Daldinia decipiens]